MNILHTYEVYQKQKDNLRRTNGWGKPIVLIQFRKQHKEFTTDDIETLDTYLRQENTKWFVADLFNILDTFPETLLKQMLQTAVREPDPSFNNEFIRPCRRVYGYEKTHSILMDIFSTGTEDAKIGVLKALYWARPTVYSCENHFDNTIEIQFGHDTFIWDDEGKYYDEEFRDDKNVFDIQGKIQKEIYEKEVQILIDTFHKTESIDLKYQIGLRLPNELSSFPEATKVQSEKYLQSKSHEEIPQDISELETFKNIKNLLFRKIALWTKRFFKNKNTITLKQR